MNIHKENATNEDKKVTWPMTEADAKAYCEQYAQMGEWERNDLEISLKEGYTYQQIAYQVSAH